MKNNKFEKGDKVKVWSLQSWNNGGFLEGELAFVRQRQKGSSVILCVKRNINGKIQLDKSYEVYAKQCELIEDKDLSLCDYYNEIMNNKYIK